MPGAKGFVLVGCAAAALLALAYWWWRGRAAPPIVPAGVWLPGEWGACVPAAGAACGAGSQSRAVGCPGGGCDPAAKPAASQPCAAPCGEWTPGEWGPCAPADGACGAGTQSREPSCPGGGCDPAAKPAAARPCAAPCAGGWAVGDWGPCAPRLGCGAGTRSRYVACPAGGCDPAAKPADSEPCEYPCEPWAPGPWGPCVFRAGAACGPGMRTRAVACPSGACDADAPPILGPCSAPCGDWVAGAWGPCLDAAGRAAVNCSDAPTTQSRSVACVARPGEPPGTDGAAPVCAGPAPGAALPCALPKCGQWVVGEWGDCSAYCGAQSTQARSVSCPFGSWCPEPAPPATRACPSAVPCSSVAWVAQPWGPCSAPCGGGTQSRGFVCTQNSMLNGVMQNWCANQGLPLPGPTSQACNTQPCPAPLAVGGAYSGATFLGCAQVYSTQIVSTIDPYGPPPPAAATLAGQPSVAACLQAVGPALVPYGPGATAIVAVSGAPGSFSASVYANARANFVPAAPPFAMTAENGALVPYGLAGGGGLAIYSV